ncbi:MAG: HTH domain-containing protein, partial [Pirellulaceae bacterium]
MDWDSVCRRAGGRRGYNWRRQFQRDYRLTLVVKLLDETGFSWGYQTRIAERLGVSRATISRDIARLFRRVWGGKEAEQRHDRQEAMKRGQRREDDLERKRLARTATEPQ